MKPTPSPPPEESALRQLQALLQGLFDWQFQRILTTRMVPAIYALGLALIAVLSLYFVLRATQESLLATALWLLLFGPALFIAGAVTLRISMEVILSLFRMARAVEELSVVVHTIGGQTQEIASDLPRIQFWRARRKPSEDAAG